MSTSKRKTILVTGASSGIGKATCLLLSGKGYSVIGTSRARDRLAGLEEEAAEKGLSVQGIELDINSDEAVAGLLPRLVEEHGVIDVLVNNAGYGLWGPIGSLTLSQIREQFDTNFFAAVRMIQAALPGMLHQRSGTIVNVSSILGRLGTPYNSGYAASKFALEGLSECLRPELSPFGVRVCLVEPGLFQTGFQENRVGGEGAQAEGGLYAQHIERYWSKHARFDRLSADPMRVAGVIERIIRSRNPALRHPVGLEARLGILGARLIPERLFQAMLRRATMG